MPDFFYELKDKIDDLVYNVRMMIPASFTEKLPLIIPGTAFGIAAVAIVFCIKTNTSANSIEDEVNRYQNGQNQLEAVLNTEGEISLSEEAENIMGRSDLILQYKDLAALEGENAFTSMEKMADVTEGEEERAVKESNNVFYDSIKEFAGNFGGILIRDPDTSSDDIKLAVYDTKSEMEPADSQGVSNVVVSRLNRTIESSQYDVKDTKDVLTIVAGEDISGFGRVREGSVMYMLLGKSLQSKTTEKYVCTAVVPGQLDDYDFSSVGEQKNEIKSSEKENSTEKESEAETSGEGEFFSKEKSYYPEASVVDADKQVGVDGNGTVTYADGTKVGKDGTVTYKDGTIVSPDGTVTYPDGMVVKPDGTISMKEGASSVGDSKSEKTENEAARETDDKSESDKESDKDLVNENGFSDDMPEVTTAGGVKLSDDKEHKVIIYSIDTKKQNVTITYWNLEETEAETDEEENNGN